MRKTLALIMILSAFTGLTTAIVGYNGSDEGPRIMKGGSGVSSASATTSVGPNGTEYRVEVAETNVSGEITNESVTLVRKGNGSIEFEGAIQAPTPCHTIDHEVEENNGSLSIDIFLDDSGEMCVQQVVMKSYEGSAKMDSLESLAVNHNGEQMAVFELEEGPENNGKKSLSKRFMDWLSNLF